MSSIAVKKLPALSVFFPCFNEEKNIPHFIEEALRVLPTVAKQYEIIIINDGSADKTREIARALARQNSRIRVVSHARNKGYGASLQTGFRKAKHPWVFFTDGDLQFSLKQLHLFLPHTKQHQVIIGFRKNRAEGFQRSRNAYLYKLFIDLLFRLHVRDIDCAFKLFHRNALESVKTESTGAFISAELLYKLKKKKFQFKQIGVDHFPRKYGKPTGSNFKVIVKACRDALQLYLHMKFHVFSLAKN